MQESRKAKTLRNLMYAWMSQGFTVIMNLLIRIVFVRVLSKDYVGISGLFSNIITLLSLAELGVGSAIVYGLYEPLANNDQKKIKALMKFYQRIYIFIGCFILVIGIALTPYLSWFIKEMPEIEELSCIYILFICNAAASYFFSYKGTLISADQKDYVLKKIRVKVLFLMYVAQIVALLTIKNYIAYLAIQVFATFIMNFGFSQAADQMYPYLREKEKVPLEQKQLQQIVKNTKALLCHKVGSVLVFSTDNLIISKFTGLGNVADYSNYILIQETLNGILQQLFSVMAPSVGNMVAVENQEKNQEMFWRIMFLNVWIYGGSAICFLCLAQDFVQLFFGEDYLVSTEILIVIIVNFYLSGMRKCVMIFKDAYGLFFQNWYMPLLESGINLITSVWLVYKIGVIGVLLGTTISSLLAPAWSEPYVLFRYGFHQPVMSYWKQYGGYFALVLITGLITWKICLWIPFIPLFSFLFKGICSMVLINGIFYIVLRRNRNMNYYLDLLMTTQRKIVVYIQNRKESN